MLSTLASALPGLRYVVTLAIAWTFLCRVLHTNHPAMVVLTESMLPTYHPGDVVFLSNRTKHMRVGDVPVVWFPDSPLPMMHRVSKTIHE